MARPIITFTSDFGTDDWFVGVVHGVIHGIAPEAHVVDVTHAVPPGDIARGAFVIEAAAPDFPAGTIHVAVVDPGVGTERRGIAVEAHGQFFVGPDNGVLEHALRSPEARVRDLVQDRFFRKPVSQTFHGRDVFAPVAAHLATGVPVADLGPAVRDPVRLKRPIPRVLPGAIRGCVIYVDRFGNALTNIEEADIVRAFPGVAPESLVIEVCAHPIRGLSRTYGHAPVGAVVAVIDSSQRLEIAMVGGDVSARFGIGVRDPVRVRVADSARAG